MVIGTSEKETSAPQFFGERTHSFCDTVCHHAPPVPPRVSAPRSRRFHIITMKLHTTARSAIMTVAGLFMAAAFAEAMPFRRSILSGDEAAEYECRRSAGEEVQESCACVAGRLGFNINCTDAATFTYAINFLSVNGICSSCEPSDECVKQFAILQTHHDYCHHEEIPEDAEQEIHDFEAFYEGCSIKRRHDPDLDDCPAGTCSTAKTELPSQAQLDAADCATDCSSPTCKEYFQAILWAHDNCEHDEILQIHETALHDLEEICDAETPTRMCNSAPDTFVRLDNSTCPESVPPPPMPPPPEPPVSPPPVLAEDDSSAWRATVNALVLCVIAVV